MRPVCSRLSVRRLSVAFALTTIVAAGTQLVTPAALAAPPSNDDIGAAGVVPNTPFTDVVDTTEATVAEGDSGCGSATVWYSFTPEASGRYQLDTFGSDYDTTVALLEGTPGHLTLLDCNDDRSGLQSAIRADLSAGTTYFIEAGTCCGGEVGQVGPGGSLQLNIADAPAPPNIAEFEWNRIRITGLTTASLSGSVSCSDGPGYVYFYGTVRQRQGLNLAQSSFDGSAACSAGVSVTATASLDFGSRVLVPKKATVTGVAYACDDFVCGDEIESTAIVPVKRR